METILSESLKRTYKELKLYFRVDLKYDQFPGLKRTYKELKL